MRAAIRLRGELIATLVLDDGVEDRPRFIEEHWSRPRRPVLGRWFEDHPRRPRVPPGVPSFFAHLLPEGAGLPRVAARFGLGVDDHFELLAAVGTEAPGAVAVIAEGEADGGEPPPAGRRLEAAALTWAAASGIGVPEHRPVTPTALPDGGFPRGVGEDVLLVRRFDRQPGGDRAHFVDFAQVLDVAWGGPGKDRGAFERVPAVVLAVGREADLAQRLLCMVFVVASGNGDAHRENRALRYPDRRDARLGPASDLVPTVLYPELDRTRHLAIGGWRSSTRSTADPSAGSRGPPAGRRRASRPRWRVRAWPSSTHGRGRARRSP